MGFDRRDEPEEDTNIGSIGNLLDKNIDNAVAEPVIQVKYSDEKEKRLAEFVAKMDENRRTGGTEGYKNSQRLKTEQLLGDLLAYSRQIENNILVGENDIFQRDEEAFFTHIDEIEMSEMKSRHAIDVKNLKGRQDQSLKDLNSRKNAKKFTRSQQRELKDLYINTQFRAQLFKKTEEVKAALKNLRERSSKIISNMEDRHLKQVKQYNAAEERGIMDQKVLIGLQCQNLTEEQKSETMKKFQSKINHQKVISKKRLDHIREQQRLELRQYKEKVDYETRMIEELSNIKETQAQVEQDFLSEKRSEIIVEKEKIASSQKNLKILDMQAENGMQFSKLLASHRIQIRQLARTQKERKIKRIKHWSVIIGRDVLLDHASVLQSQAGSVQSKSQVQSVAHSRKNSDPNIAHSSGGFQFGSKQNNQEDADDLRTVSNNREMTTTKEKENLVIMQKSLVELKKKHDVDYYALKQKHDNDHSEMNENFTSEMAEMEMRHEIEKKRLTTDNESEIEETLRAQDKELVMEGHIRNAETKALIERKVLNSLLDTFVDGVISIDPRGFIKRFNAAAERMFGYSGQYLLENNVNIKQLMPKKFSENHDNYLYSYFSTGVKKVIGMGREVTGLKKDGSEFPIHLSISEVVEDGFHLFTAIVRDLTEIVEDENQRQATENQMMWKISKYGKVLSLNQRIKKYCGITTPEQEAAVDVFSKDLVHPEDYQASRDAFDKGCRTMTTFEVKRRLKSAAGTYRYFLTVGIPVFDTKNVFKFWCGSCTDIDDASILETELLTLQEKLPVLLWKSKTSGELYYSNNALSLFTGRDFTKSSIPLFSEEICYPSDIPELQEAFGKALKKKTPFEIKARLKSKKGAFKWFIISGSPILDGTGIVQNFYGIATDIDEATVATLENEALLEVLPQMIWKVDINGNCLSTNKQFKSYAGISSVTGVNVFDISVVHPDDHAASLAAFKKGSADKTQFTIKRRLKSAKGVYKQFLTKAVPVLDDAGQLIFWFGYCSPAED